MTEKLIISQKHIENWIFTIRGVQVMLDGDRVEIYGVSTSRLNEQVKRNEERFPNDFMFQLTKEEWDNLKSQNAISSQHGDFIVKSFSEGHDHFLVINNEEGHHSGASLKDLGKKPVVSTSNHGLLFPKWKGNR